MKIGIFGGTFNPIHIGHLKVAENIKEIMGLDLIFMVPTYKTPGNKFDPERIKPSHRYNMVVDAVKETGWSWLKVSNIEVKSHELSYTYLTLEKFHHKYPNDKLYFIMGDDQFKHFDSWKNPQFIRQVADLIVFKRGKGLNVIPQDKGITFLGETTYDVSSTQILANLEWEKIPPAAKIYIAKNRLYLKTLAFKLLKEDRFQHTMAVAVNAKRLSKQNHYHDDKKAYDVGLAHDLFKMYSNKFLFDFYNQYGSTETIPPINALHGYCAALWLEKVYELKDQEFLNAVKRHTIPCPKPTLLDKIIYVSDKTSMDRKGDNMFALRKLAYFNLNLTFEKIFRETVSRLLAKDIELDVETKTAYNKLFNIKVNDEGENYGALKKLN